MHSDGTYIDSESEVISDKTLMHSVQKVIYIYIYIICEKYFLKVFLSFYFYR